MPKIIKTLSTSFLLILLAQNPVTANTEKAFEVGCSGGTPRLIFQRAAITEAFKRLDRKVDFSAVPVERSLRLANNGEIDADCSRIKQVTKTYTNLVQVPETIFTLNFHAFSNDKNFNIRQWEDLKPHVVATVVGWKLAEINLQRVKPDDYLAVSDEYALFKMLNANRIDLAVFALLDGQTKLKELGFSQIKPIDPPLQSVPLYFSMNKKNQHLVEPLNRVFKEMKQDGTWDKLFQSVL